MRLFITALFNTRRIEKTHLSLWFSWGNCDISIMMKFCAVVRVVVILGKNSHILFWNDLQDLLNYKNKVQTVYIVCLISVCVHVLLWEDMKFIISNLHVPYIFKKKQKNKPKQIKNGYSVGGEREKRGECGNRLLCTLFDSLNFDSKYFI